MIILFNELSHRIFFQGPNHFHRLIVANYSWQMYNHGERRSHGVTSL
jgi:hypothetical protein